jgi:hypothetical protein
VTDLYSRSRSPNTDLEPEPRSGIFLVSTGVVRTVYRQANSRLPTRPSALVTTVMFARPLLLVPILIGLLALLALPLSAQEVRQPRAPIFELRPTPTPTALELLPDDSLPRFDPTLDLVRPFEPDVAAPELRPPRISGVGVLSYIAQTQQLERERLWRRAWAERLAGRDRKSEGLIPELENPLKVPEPLARVFGEGSEFDIQGRLHLAGVGSKSRQRPDLRPELLRQTVGNFDLDLDQVLDLKIRGAVGTKLDTTVDFNSARELDSKQLIVATYTGTEDEIVKKVEVGDIQVRLPPSRFVSGGIARGTFGLQAIGQLGPVDLRFLGSRKEGQSTARALRIAPRGEGILQEVTLDIKDTQFQDDRFYLLFHSDSLATGRLVYPNPGTELANPASIPEEGTLSVWLDDGNFNNNREQASKRGTALVDPLEPLGRPEESHDGFFDQLVEGQDYVVTDQLILQLKRQLGDAEVLAVAYTTRGGTQVGSLASADTLTLKLIKPVNPDTLDFTWDYTLRNIYSLREPNIQLASLGLTIYRGNRDLKQTFEIVGGATQKYSEIFGVTDANSRVNVPRILRDPFGGPDLLVLPDVRPFFRPTSSDGQPIELERPNRKLYFNSDPRRTALDDQVYFIEASYLSRGGVTGEVELGAANIIEGSEEIAIGGVTLVRGEDYQIFYDFGRVVFTDPAGLAQRYPNEAIHIGFEVAPLFNLAPTSLYGGAGTWHAGRDAVVNSAILVQRQQSLANRPILGAEPTQTLIAEVDGSVVRNLPRLTSWVDGLPGVETSEPSVLSLRGELAWSQPDPNTQGEVFLNDFENIEVAKRVSTFFRSWSLSSVPAESELSIIDFAPVRWYTFATPSSQITPGVRGIDRLENKFVVRLEPRGETPAERERSWRSIHTVLSSNGEDVSRQEFIEFFVRGEEGTIVVDLGTVAEDQLRVDEDNQLVGIGRLDTEESNPNTRDNNLDTNEDTGVDAVRGGDFQEVPGDDGNDDFDETPGSNGFPTNPNGTENNTVLDTEDDNLNGILDSREDVLRWVVDLADSRYEIPGSRNRFGFRQMRLPLENPDALVGNPDLRNVRVLRMAFSGVELATEFELALLEIVGSTWLERGIVDAQGVPIAGSDSDSLQVAAINDLENPDYRSPPGVVAERERADEIAGLVGVIREQSLEFTYKDLPAGARGAIYRPLFDRESYIDYGSMRLWVQGRAVTGGPQPMFFVAFGIDTLNVYEYAAPLRDLDWEEHVIDFDVFTELKRGLVDSLNAARASVGERISEDGRYRVRITTPNTPPPTLTDVSQLSIGVENPAGGPVAGSFWIDEWRLTAPVRIGGAAGHLDARVRLAGLAEVAVSYETRGARYRDIGAARNNFQSGHLDWSAQVQLDRFLPESWGMALPLTYNHLDRRDAPLFRVGSDIEVREGEKRAMARTTDNDYVTLRAYRKRQSSNPLIAATLDRLEARLSWVNDAHGSFDLDSDRGRWDTWIGYHHGFRAGGLPIGLGWLARLPWPGVIQRSDALQRLASADLNLVPANISLSAQTIFEERESTKTLGESAELTADSTRQLVGNAQVAFQPFQSMRATVGWDNTRDLIFPETVIDRGALGVDALRVQSFTFDWSPPVAAWLIPRYSYSTSFNRNHTREASRSLDSLDLRDFAVIKNSRWMVDLIPTAIVGAIGRTPVARGQEPWWARLFEPIRFDRSNQEGASYVQTTGDPGFGFAFGFGNLDRAVAADPQNVSTSEGWGVSTGFGLVPGLDLRAAYRENATERRYFQGANASSTRTWPDVAMRYTGPRPPGFLGRWIASWTVTSDFERRVSENRVNELPLDDGDRRLWNPIFGLTVNWANGMTIDLRANTSRSTTRLARGGEFDSRRRERSQDLLLNLNYPIRSGTKIYIPFPTLWGVTLRSPLRTALTVARRDRDDETGLADALAAEDALNLKVRSTEVRPSVSYEFGRVVTGFALSYLSRIDLKRDITYTTYSAETFLDFLF